MKISLMLVALAAVALPRAASADYMDVIEVKLSEKCSVQEYVAIKDDFNEQCGKKNRSGTQTNGQGAADVASSHQTYSQWCSHR